LSEKEVLEVVAKHSPENFCELKISNYSLSNLFPYLELFFINWKSRASKKSLTLIIMNSYDLNEKNIKIIEKYENLGVIEKFECKDYDYDYGDEENKDLMEFI
jgi:hypothetical protein